VSTDGGESWVQSADLPYPVLSFALDPFQAGTVYAGTLGAFLRSTNSGASWDTLFAANPTGPADEGYWFFSIVPDPVRRNRLYASTSYGVVSSPDGGRSWLPFSRGLPVGEAKALAVSPDGRRLHVATYEGVFELDLASTYPCTPSAVRLCLVGGRYAVELDARRGEMAWTPGTARPLGDRAGYFSLPFVTGDPDLPEVAVKMLADGSFGASGAPVFYSSLTTLPFELTVTDTVTGETRTFAGDADRPFCGGTQLLFRDALAGTSEPADAAGDGGGEPLRLLDGRFSITLEARHPRSGASAGGQVILSGDSFGVFSLPGITGDPQFPEVVVKMIDARSFSGRFWFFQTGLTSADYTLTVTDSVTGAVRTYVGATPFCGTADTDAFTDTSPNTSRVDLNGYWTGSVTFPSDCYTCRSPETTRVTLSQVGKTVTGHFSTECLGDRELFGTLDGDQLTIDFNSGNGRFMGSVTSTAIHVEKNCDYWGYGSDHTMQLDLSR